MKIVKLSFNYSWPVFRQTPKSAGIWNDYQFVIDPDLDECDFWVVFADYGLETQKCTCNKQNIIFIPGEGRKTSTHFSPTFLNQFGRVLTVQREITGRNVSYQQNANPWFIGRTFDELIELRSPAKPRAISIVSSTKTITAGHRKRLAFAKRLKKQFGDDLDLFGRGINDFKDKWDVTAPYKYHIAIENDFCDDLVTEKLFDPLLTFTLPIYYGCPNLDKYISADSFVRINIDDFEGSIAIIRRLIEDPQIYQKSLDAIGEARTKYLLHLQFFPAIVSIIETLDSQLPKTEQTVSADSKRSFVSRIRRKFSAKLSD